MDSLDARYCLVRDWMAEHGQPKEPLHVAPADVVLRSFGNMDLTVLALPEELDGLWFGNGHRRLAIAVELGWDRIFTTPDVFYSGAEYEALRGGAPKVFKVNQEEAMELFPEASIRGQKWIDWATAQFEAAGLEHLIR